MYDRYVVCDEARQQLVYYGNDPKRTLVELHLTEEPKGALCSVQPWLEPHSRFATLPRCSFTGTISLKNAHIEVMDKPVKGAPTKFTFKLITADRVSYLSVKCVELPVREARARCIQSHKYAQDTRSHGRVEKVHRAGSPVQPKHSR